MRQKWGLFRAIAIVTLLAAFVVLHGDQLTRNLIAANQSGPDSGEIQGRLVYPNGKPAGNTVVTLVTIPGRGQFPLMLGTANTNATGKFSFGGIAPGTYNVQASSLSGTTSEKVSVIRNATTPVIMILR